jgi:hypothetical protein
MRAEGWYHDPFELHAERWFSDDVPTDLVRDGGVESRDEPPAREYARPLVESTAQPLENGSDLKRADDVAGYGKRLLNPVEAASAVVDDAVAYGVFFN